MCLGLLFGGIQRARVAVLTNTNQTGHVFTAEDQQRRNFFFIKRNKWEIRQVVFTGWFTIYLFHTRSPNNWGLDRKWLASGSHLVKLENPWDSYPPPVVPESDTTRQSVVSVITCMIMAQLYWQWNCQVVGKLQCNVDIRQAEIDGADWMPSV